MHFLIFPLVFVSLSIVSVTTAWAGPKEDVQAYLAKPTRPAARALVNQANAALAPLVAEYGSQPKEIQTAVLHLIVLLPDSADRTAFLEKIKMDSKESALHHLLASFADLFEHPGDSRRQDELDAYLKAHPSRELALLDTSFLGDKGLAFLSAFLERGDDLSPELLQILAHLIQRDFPSEAASLLTPLADKITVEALARYPLDQDVFEEKLESLLSEIQDSEWQSTYVQDLLKDTSFSKQNSFRSSLVGFALDNAKKVDEQTVKALNAFYCNAETAPQPATESITHLGDRRDRLLQFVEIVRRLQLHGDAYAVSRLLFDNIDFISNSDLAEFRVGMQTAAVKLRSPELLVEKPLFTAKANQIIFGLQLARGIPSDYWKKNKFRTLEDRVLSLSQFGFPAHPESVRLEAAQTYRHMLGEMSAVDSILAGLSAKDISDRIKAIDFLSDADVTPALTESLARVIGGDDVNVRIAALELVAERLKQSENAEEMDGFALSYKMGEKILSNWKQTDAKLLEAAEEALELYLKVSPHALTLIKAGTGSSVPAIQKISEKKKKEWIDKNLWSAVKVLQMLPDVKDIDSGTQETLKSLDFELKQRLSGPKP